MVKDSYIAGGQAGNTRREEVAPLSGGRAGKIFKRGETIERPVGAWTADIQRFLGFMRDSGADFVPEPLGITSEGERLSYMPGEVYHNPLEEVLANERTLISAADLLRRFHQYGEAYLSRLTGRECWMLPAQAPAEVMCHGDYATYNVTIVDGSASGIIDFDTLHPGPRLWDVAYGVYRWVPFVFTSEDKNNAREILHGQIRKTKLFLDNYGAIDRNVFVPVLVQRLSALTAFMEAEAAAGNRDFIQNIIDGHLAQYQQDIRYLLENADEITRGIGHRQKA